MYAFNVTVTLKGTSGNMSVLYVDGYTNRGFLNLSASFGTVVLKGIFGTLVCSIRDYNTKGTFGTHNKRNSWSPY